jgi:hypothetical protein
MPCVGLGECTPQTHFCIRRARSQACGGFDLQEKGAYMSFIGEMAARLGIVAPAANPGAYLAYIASLVIEFGAGASLFVVLGIRLGRSLSRWVANWDVAPEKALKLAIPIACLLTSVGLLLTDIR